MTAFDNIGFESYSTKNQLNMKKDEKPTRPILNFEMTDTHVDHVCKPGSGEKTCLFLRRTDDGYLCTKFTSMAAVANQRAETGQSTAKANNCNGVLLNLAAIKDKLAGTTVSYHDPVSKNSHKGVVKSMHLDLDYLTFEYTTGNEDAVHRMNTKNVMIVDQEDGICFTNPDINGSADKFILHLEDN